jgi:hypothetical protein
VCVDHAVQHGVLGVARPVVRSAEGHTGDIDPEWGRRERPKMDTSLREHAWSANTSRNELCGVRVLSPRDSNPRLEQSADQSIVNRGLELRPFW